MARIAQSAVLNPVKEILDTFQDEGGIRISPAEADRVAQQAYEQGNVSGSWLARETYAALKRQEAKYGKVTAQDCNVFFSMVNTAVQMVDGTAGDPKGPSNGLSKDELNALGPELGRIAVLAIGLSKMEKAMAIKSKPGRESKDIAYRGIDFAAQRLIEAMGPEGRLNFEKELPKALDGMVPEVQFLVTALLSTAIGIAESQAQKAGNGGGNIVTADEVENAARVHKGYIAKRDKGRPGFDNAELAKLSPMQKAAYHVGRAIDAGIIR